MIVPQIPTIDMRAYYRFDGNTNDLSGHGFNLAYDPADGTGIGPASFGSGDSLFQGTSGSVGGAFRTASILSSTTPSALTVSFWFTLRNDTSSNANARLFEICANIAGGSVLHAGGYYNISAGNVTYTFFVNYTTTIAVVTYTVAANITAKKYFTFTYDSATKVIRINVNGYFVMTHTGVGTLTCPTGTHAFVIGASRAEDIKSWGLHDEFIVEERVWTEQEIRRYYTKTRGFFV